MEETLTTQFRGLMSRNLILFLFSGFFFLSVSSVKAESLVPFVENNRYACWQDQYGTALVRMRDYSLLQFSSLIRKTTSEIRKLERRLVRLTKRGATAGRRDRLQARIDKLKRFRTELRNCRNGTLPGQAPTKPTPPTPPPSSSDAPCDVAGDQAGVATRIINGTACKVGNSPVVELKLMASGKEVGWCSGTALTKRAVLTAAHCLTDGVTSVTVYGGGTSRTSSAFFYHPGYDPYGDETNDIGVVLLSGDLPTRTISLISASASFTPGEKAIIAGYGLDERGKSGTLKAGTMTVERATSYGILSSFNGSGSNSCSGDSGGPYLVKRSGQWVIGGTTSWGIKENCSAGDKSYFTNIASPSNQNFIKQYVSGLK